MLIVDPINITAMKCTMPLQSQRIKIIPQPTKPKLTIKAIEGSGFEELTDSLKKLSVKDSMKNIRITM